jgi:hypothetical protein
MAEGTIESKYQRVEKPVGEGMWVGARKEAGMGAEWTSRHRATVRRALTVLRARRNVRGGVQGVGPRYGGVCGAQEDPHGHRTWKSAAYRSEYIAARVCGLRRRDMSYLRAPPCADGGRLPVDQHPRDLAAARVREGGLHKSARELPAELRLRDPHWAPTSVVRVQARPPEHRQVREWVVRHSGMAR